MFVVEVFVSVGLELEKEITVAVVVPCKLVISN